MMAGLLDKLSTFWLRAILRLILRCNFVVEMEMVDGSSAKGMVRYTVGFKLPDGRYCMAKRSRIYEDEPQ